MKLPEYFDGERHKVLQLLGEGGMAVVFLAVDRQLQRPVAIKMPRPNLVLHEKDIDRFAQETITMARATHPNVVTLYDAKAQEVNGTLVPYLVMELVAGVTVEDAYGARNGTRFGKMSPRLAARIILSVLTVLSILHEAGLVHRDIKPSNVMVGYDPGVIKLMDFGIARVAQDCFDGADRQTKTSIGMYSPGFSAPEQMAAAKQAGPRADLYAVGSTLYAMVTGRDPEDLHNQMLSDPEFQAVPGCLRTIIYGATRYRPNDRAYSTAKEMSAALTSAVVSEPEEDESAFRDWLAKRRASSPVEAALHRAFGRKYTVVPEMQEGKGSVAAGFTKWFQPSEAPPSEVVSLVPAARPKSRLIPAAVGGLSFVAALTLAAVVYVGSPPERTSAAGLEDQADTVAPAGTPKVLAVQPDTPLPNVAAEVVSTPSAKVDRPPKTPAPAAVSTPGPAVTPPPVEQTPAPTPEPTPAPEPPRGTIRLAGGADRLSLVAADGTVYSAGRVPPGTYSLRAEFPNKGTAPNAGSATVAAGQTLSVTCNETFKLCSAQ